MHGFSQILTHDEQMSGRAEVRLQIGDWKGRLWIGERKPHDIGAPRRQDERIARHLYAIDCCLLPARYRRFGPEFGARVSHWSSRHDSQALHGLRVSTGRYEIGDHHVITRWNLVPHFKGPRDRLGGMNVRKPLEIATDDEEVQRTFMRDFELTCRRQRLRFADDEPQPGGTLSSAGQM